MLIIFATHPIQYQVPLWKKMTEAGINLEVWYFTDFGINASYDVQFGKSFSWDIPMLNGYSYRFLRVNDGASPNKGFRGIIAKDNLKKLLLESEATHVYINGWQVSAYWQALWAAKSIGLNIIFKGESNDIKPEPTWKWPVKKLLLSQFFKHINHFLYIGEANKRLYLKHNIDERILLPGLYCVDNDRFHHNALNQKKHREEIRKNWGIEEEAFCLLFSGKFISKKRPLDIVRAVNQLNRNKNIHIVYVGDGELYEEIKNNAHIVYDKSRGMVNENNSKRVKVSIIGFLNQTEIPKAYAIADCLILPSDYGETWGLVVNEAMASGIPAIVSNECGCAEDLANPISSNLVYDCGNIQALAKSIKWIIENPISEIKIQNVIEKYNYNSTLGSVEKILEKLN